MTSVYLGGLPKGISERELRGHLEIYGRLNALSITDKGFAFVEYESETDAKDVVKNFFGKPFMGYDIKIELAKKPRRKLPLPSYPHPVVDRDCVWGHSNDRPFVRFPVVVYNLNPRTCWQELKDFGRIAGGDPVYCDIDRSDRTRGYLEFYSEDAADQFVKAGNGKELLDNIVELHPLGRRKLRPEHGPPSRSPTLSHHRRHSSASSTSVARDAPFPRTPRCWRSST
ncbi:hypothetical protein BDY19DRAFT_567582 [Irpex rosettiformis]|uniref:Uncharacterized protein n=1 Tax=Irpex rosettiformis TaxID=378272 RepID=A0ACB8UD94_9APHY|nr:hypothetical protein BDY19DRAFT_567582 [Irpex rosettiformis]